MPSWLSEDDPWLVTGMRAATQIARAEQQLLTATATAMGNYLDAARIGVLGGRPPKAFALGYGSTSPVIATATAPEFSGWPPDSLWIALVEQYIVPAAHAVFDTAFNTVVQGVAVGIDAWRSAYVATVRDRLSPQLWPRQAFEYVRGLVDDAVRTGSTIDQIRDLVSSVLTVTGRVDGEPVWQWQARRIARTETMGAYNGGTALGAQAWQQETGEQLFKQWLATSDTRTRNTHRIAHGQVVSLAEQFSVGGSSLLFPGDPTGQASEVINCRCTLLVLKAEEAAQQATRYATTSPETALAASASPTFQGEAMPPQTGEALPQRWRGVLTQLDTMSGDRRIFQSPNGEPRVRPLPVALRYTPADWGEHMGAISVGNIERVWVEGNNLMGEGRFDIADPAAAEVVRKIRDGFHRWVSVDLDDFTAEAMCLRDGTEIDCEMPEEASEEQWAEIELGTRVTDWRLAAATLVDIPAFPEAAIELIEDTANDEVADESSVEQAAILAAAGPLAPPVEWFTDPKLEGPTPLTILDNGQVFGHLATWDTCHIGYPDTQCQTPPRSPSGYASFHVGEIKCADGRLLPVGNLILGTRHADIHATYAATMTHYSDSGHAVAAVRAGEDAHGIWVAGSLLPDVDEAKIATLRRSPLSGDWRVINGQRDLAAALAVNVPGFPVRRERVEAGRTVALVAAGVIPPRREAPEPARAFARQVADELRAIERQERAHNEQQKFRQQRREAALESVRCVRAAAAKESMEGAAHV